MPLASENIICLWDVRLFVRSFASLFNTEFVSWASFWFDAIGWNAINLNSDTKWFNWEIMTTGVSIRLASIIKCFGINPRRHNPINQHRVKSKRNTNQQCDVYVCVHGFYGWLFHHNLIDLIRARVHVCWRVVVAVVLHARCIQQKRHNVSFGLVKMPPIICGSECDAVPQNVTWSSTFTLAGFTSRSASVCRTHLHKTQSNAWMKV